jgi:hypothetical protein
MQFGKVKNEMNLVGKRISVIHPKWPTQRMIGICQFAGINPLHGKFQVTIDRMPIWPVNPKEIIVIKTDNK